MTYQNLERTLKPYFDLSTHQRRAFFWKMYDEKSNGEVNPEQVFGTPLPETTQIPGACVDNPDFVDVTLLHSSLRFYS